MNFEKRGGRPREDRVARRLEIYSRVVPLLEHAGIRDITMRKIAKASCMSVSALYHYFPSKHAILLYGIEPEAWHRVCDDLAAAHEHLRTRDPAAYVEAFLERTTDLMFFIRPALYAALELGPVAIWDKLDAGVQHDVGSLKHSLRAAVPDVTEDELEAIGKTFRRYFLTTMVDRNVTHDEVLTGMQRLIGRDPNDGQHDGATRFRLKPIRRTSTAAHEIVWSLQQRSENRAAKATAKLVARG